MVISFNCLDADSKFNYWLDIDRCGTGYKKGKGAFLKGHYDYGGVGCIGTCMAIVMALFLVGTMGIGPVPN